MIGLPLLLAAALAIPSGVQSTSSPDGGIDYPGNVHINNKVFDSHIRQAVWSRTASNWGVRSNAPAGNTGVLSYPSRQDIEYLPISSLRALRAKYSYTNPARGDYEGAFDIWVQPNGKTTDWVNDFEVMVWTTNHGQTPAGHVVGTLSTPYDQSYTVWRDSDIVTLVDRHPSTHSTTHLLSILRALIASGYFPSTSALLDVEDGWEICSTGGQAEDFIMNNYVLTRVLK